MDTPNDRGTVSFDSVLDSGSANNDWNNMDYADMANYRETSALDPLADALNDHNIASNSYLITSDIIFDD